MKSIPRRPAAVVVGFAFILILGSAAPAQMPSDGAARTSSFISSLTERWARLVPISRPRSCFCDEDCYAALLKKERLFRYPLNWPPRMVPDEKEVREIKLEDLKKLLQRDPKDSRPLLINFWATWCDPCREEFPDLVKVDNDYRGKGLNFVAISLDDISDIKSIVPKFLNEMKAEMPVVLLNVNDPEPAIKLVDATWDGQLPATFLYDKEGKILFKHFGKIKPDELRAAIDKAVGNKQ